MMFVALVARDSDGTFRLADPRPALAAEHFRAVKDARCGPATGAANAVGPAFDRAEANSAVLWK
jgi:hypothetical protein